MGSMIISSLFIILIIFFFVLFILCVAATPDVSLLISVEIWSLRSAAISFSVLVDFASLVFSITVALISMRVFVYSSYYVIGIANYTAFHFILFVFVLSILTLIFRPNIISLILG